MVSESVVLIVVSSCGVRVGGGNIGFSDNGDASAGDTQNGGNVGEGGGSDDGVGVCCC